jgi:hypothetical protein
MIQDHDVAELSREDERPQTSKEKREAFWDRVSQETNRIEDLNNADDADPEGTLAEVGNILENLEIAGSFVTGVHTTEVVCLVAAVARAIFAANFSRFRADPET